MKLAVLATLGICVAATPVLSAQLEFRGSLCLRTVTAACAPEGYSTSSCLWMRFLPPNLLDNGTATRLTLLDYGGSENYTLASGSLNGTLFQPVGLTGVYRSAFQTSASMRITAQVPAPANLSATSDSVVLTGNIQGFDGTTGCNVQFKAAGVRKTN